MKEKCNKYIIRCM